MYNRSNLTGNNAIGVFMIKALYYMILQFKQRVVTCFLQIFVKCSCFSVLTFQLLCSHRPLL